MPMWKLGISQAGTTHRGWQQMATFRPVWPFYFGSLLVLMIVPFHVLFRFRIQTKD